MSQEITLFFRKNTVKLVRRLIDSKDWKELKLQINELRPLEVAELITELNENERIILFRLFTREQAKEVFENLEVPQQQQIIEGLAEYRHTLTNLLNDLEPDDRTAFFEELPGEVTQGLIRLLSPEEKEIARGLLGYPEDSIGRLMTPAYVAVKPQYTVARALEHIRRYGEDSETLNVIYVVDDNWKLLGDVRIRELILASPDRMVSEFIDPNFIALNAQDDQEVAVKEFMDYDRVALPVVNTDGLLLGIVTVDDVLDVTTEESTEDFHKFGGG